MGFLAEESCDWTDSVALLMVWFILLLGVPIFYYFMNSPVSSKAPQKRFCYKRGAGVFFCLLGCKCLAQPKHVATRKIVLFGSWLKHFFWWSWSVCSCKASTLLSTAIAFGMTLTLLQTVGLVGFVSMKWPSYMQGLIGFASWLEKCSVNGPLWCFFSFFRYGSSSSFFRDEMSYFWHTMRSDLKGVLDVH